MITTSPKLVSVDSALLHMALILGSGNNTKNVKAPPMVGPTWTRVRLTLGLDCFPRLFQGTALLLPYTLCPFVVRSCMFNV